MLVHVQRLLPLESLLSDAAQSVESSTGTAPRLSVAASSSTPPQASRNPFTASPATRENARPSPFEADRARKTHTEEATAAVTAEGRNPFAASKAGTAGVADNGANSVAIEKA